MVIEHMKIWVDADACPQAVKNIIVSASVKRSVQSIFVANQVMDIPDSELISFKLVSKEPDAADNYIQENSMVSDMVITQDIPLAHALVSKKVTVMDPRGILFTDDNINERLSVRDLMYDLREANDIKGGPKPYGEKEKRTFASTFDKELTRLLKKNI